MIINGHQGASALDYMPCSYGSSRLRVRGPKRKADKGFVSTIGGRGAFGRFVVAPFPHQLEELGQISVVNLGASHAGIDAYVRDEDLLGLCQRASVVLMEIPPALDLSNRFYSVHPRRNDRFVQASPMMRRVFPEMDFTKVCYTRHLVNTVMENWPDRAELLIEDLQMAWISGIERLLERLGGKVILLWMAGYSPPDEPRMDLGWPELVTKKMISNVRPMALDYVEVIPSWQAQTLGLEGMKFHPHEARIAAETPGPLFHREVAKALLPVIEKHLAK